MKVHTGFKTISQVYFDKTLTVYFTKTTISRGITTMLQQTPDFSNPQFLKFPTTRTKSHFPIS